MQENVVNEISWFYPQFLPGSTTLVNYIIYIGQLNILLQWKCRLLGILYFIIVLLITSSNRNYNSHRDLISNDNEISSNFVEFLKLFFLKLLINSKFICIFFIFMFSIDLNY